MFNLRKERTTMYQKLSTFAQNYCLNDKERSHDGNINEH